MHNKLPSLQNSIKDQKSRFSLKMDFSHQNPNSNPIYTFFPESVNPMPDFEVSDYLLLDGSIFDDDTSSQSMLSSEKGMAAATELSGATSKNCNIKCKNGVGKNKSELGVRVAFRMKSEMEVIDDGYKWRKYGKKSIKDNPNPRNYYKCSSVGCNVKKRIERDVKDQSYVVTTYEGVHNHETPSMVYYNQMSIMAPNAWTFQASLPSSSST
ncbi:probable WRKY transcription factor 51 [Gossypium arboreum]|uniref:probable WRKY transcription factor 51 n=1 Tax=Gossypium arboreum TaxID=29729 RepID=UPI0022F1D63F|nr:probable WRKY transcription factor 51 [Gossypium arboreum]